MNPQFGKGLLIVNVILLAMLGLSVQYVRPGSATYVVIQLSVIHIVAAMIIISALIYFDWDPFRAFR